MSESTALQPIDHLGTAISNKADQFKAVLPAHISVEKFQRTIQTAVLSSPKLFDCTLESILTACMKAAQDGLLPDGREAALVPFANRQKGADGRWSSVWEAQYMPMAYGLRKKVLQSGEVISLQVGVVYASEVANGNFVWEVGIDPPVRHRPKLDMTEEEMADGNLVAAYSIARLKNDHGEPFWSVDVMRRFEVLKVRQMSQTGALNKTDRQGNPIPPKGPWVEWEPEMWKKTALRRHSKVLPMSGDILAMILREDEEQIANSAANLLAGAAQAGHVVMPSDEEFDRETGEMLTDQSGTEAGVPLETGGQPEPEKVETGQPAAAAPTTEKTQAPAPEQPQAPAASPSEPAVDPGTGMTEVDEETARSLDAGDDGWGDDEGEDEGEAEQQQVSHEIPAWQASVDRVIDLIGIATGKDSWLTAETEFLKIAGTLPDETAKDVEGRLNAKRKELMKK